MPNKLGKLPPEFKETDLLFGNIMRATPVPPAYDWDKTHPGVPTPMFGNDTLGDCVMAGRAHQTLRFEYAEQKKIIKITDKEVTNEYFKETGGGDDGLVVSQSLSKWRRYGWTASGAVYKLRAYSRVQLNNRTQIKAAIYADLGVGIGFEVPSSAMTQFDQHKPWDVVRNPGPIEGGHYVYVEAYDAIGITCITWAAHQRMTWAFWDKYTDEVWANIDAVDTPKRQEIIDVAMVNEFLDTLPA